MSGDGVVIEVIKDGKVLDSLKNISFYKATEFEIDVSHSVYGIGSRDIVISVNILEKNKNENMNEACQCEHTKLYHNCSQDQCLRSSGCHQCECEGFKSK